MTGRMQATVKVRLFRHLEYDPETECLTWTGARDPKGYGRINVNRRAVLAHRLMYRLWVEEIPDGLQLDHLCRNPPCVNPDHLEPVTSAENTRRGVSFQGAKTHCPQGHPYSEDNTGYVRRADGRGQGRTCRICRREANRLYRRRLKERGQ